MKLLLPWRVGRTTGGGLGIWSRDCKADTPDVCFIAHVPDAEDEARADRIAKLANFAAGAHTEELEPGGLALMAVLLTDADANRKAMLQQLKRCAYILAECQHPEAGQLRAVSGTTVDLIRRLDPDHYGRVR